MKMKVKFNENKRCPICKQPLKKFNYWDLPEWIYQCRNCNYMIHWLDPYLELRINEFHKRINIRDISKKDKINKRCLHKARVRGVRGRPMNSENAFYEFGQEIKKANIKYLKDAKNEVPDL